MQNLWNDLEVSRDHQQNILNDTSCAAKTLENLQNELDRCKALRLCHLPMNIEQLREVILEWTDRCKRVIDRQSPIFGAGIYDEKSLRDYNAELDKLKSYYKENKPILQQLAQYDDLKKQLTELLDCEKTADYWKNRGGLVTKNETKKKAISQKLVTVETSLKKLLAAYSMKHNAQFTVFGKPPVILPAKNPVQMKRYASEADLRLKPKKPFGDRNQ